MASNTTTTPAGAKVKRLLDDLGSSMPANLRASVPNKMQKLALGGGAAFSVLPSDPGSAVSLANSNVLASLNNIKPGSGDDADGGHSFLSKLLAESAALASSCPQGSRMATQSLLMGQAQLACGLSVVMELILKMQGTQNATNRSVEALREALRRTESAAGTTTLAAAAEDQRKYLNLMQELALKCHSGQFREPFQNIHGLNPQNTAASQNGISITDLLKNVNIQATAENFGLTDLVTEEQLRARFVPGAGGNTFVTAFKNLVMKLYESDRNFIQKELRDPKGDKALLCACKMQVESPDFNKGYLHLLHLAIKLGEKKFGKQKAPGHNAGARAGDDDEDDDRDAVESDTDPVENDIASAVAVLEKHGATAWTLASLMYWVLVKSDFFPCGERKTLLSKDDTHYQLLCEIASELLDQARNSNIRVPGLTDDDSTEALQVQITARKAHINDKASTYWAENLKYPPVDEEEDGGDEEHPQDMEPDDDEGEQESTVADYGDLF